MYGVRNDQQFLIPRKRIVPYHIFVGIPAEIAGMSLLSMDHKDRTADLIGIAQDRLIKKGHAAGHVPASVGVEGTGMISSVRLIISIIIFYKERGILRQRIHHAAAQGIAAVFVIFDTLCVPCLFLLIAGVCRILGIKITFRVYTGHIIHSRSNRSSDPGVKSRCVQSHSAPAADPDNGDLLRIHIVLHRQEIHRRLEILGIDIRRGHISWLPAAFSCEGRIKGDGQKSPLRHGLGVESGRLLLHRSKRPAHRDGRQPPLRSFRRIEIRRQGNAIPVVESHLPVIHFITLGKCFIPFFC